VRGAGGAALRLEGLGKSYGGVTAVAGVSLAVHAGEFVTLLGPSGSGKTTTLMMIAGFVAPSAGEIMIDSRPVARVPPEKRGLGMVFQNYALFPHMTVAANIAFPLKMRGWPRAEWRPRVARALEMVKLPGYEERFPRQLSGGQQQRVALARALVFEPRVLLMDEPLGALDKKLREHMQAEIKRIQRALGVTVLYVTHDQEEALTMSDRIVVMRDGRIEQFGTPVELYEEPANAFVADFIGESNFLSGTVVGFAPDGSAELRGAGGRRFRAAPRGAVAAGAAVAAALRPERLRLMRNGEESSGEENCWEGRVAEIVYLGEAIKLRVAVDELTLTAKMRNGDGGPTPCPGDRVRLAWRADHTVLLGTPQPGEEAGAP